MHISGPLSTNLQLGIVLTSLFNEPFAWALRSLGLVFGNYSAYIYLFKLQLRNIKCKMDSLILVLNLNITNNDSLSSHKI